MSLRFGEGGHKWKLVTPENPVSAEHWAKYFLEYQMRDGTPDSGTRGRPKKMYHCAICHTTVSLNGPRREDQSCIEVATRHVMEA